MPNVARASHLLIHTVAAVFALAALSGCSSVPDWVDPTSWGDSSSSAQPAPTTDSSGAATDAGGPQGTTVAEANDQYPVLADTPSKAPPAMSSDEQKQVANALVADRAQAQYSAEALQAGKEPAAAPPPPASSDGNIPIPPPSAPADQSVGTVRAAVTPPPAAPTRTASAEPAGPAPMPGTLPVDGPSPPPAAQVAPTSPAISTTPPSTPSLGATGAMPSPVSAAPPAMAVAPDDAALGFQPSHAPPLDPAVAQLMGNPPPARRQHLASLGAPGSTTARAYAPAGGAATAVVVFPANTMVLDASGMAQVQSAIAAWRAKGGQGYVRIVGHAASGAPKLPADRRMTQSLERSQACATAVARELIKQGVPADRVLVDATASLSDGEQRRAEIFLQS